jgi:pilus assembly protein CpaB
MQKRLIILIIGIVLAFISVFMVKVYLDQQSQALKEQQKKEMETIRANQAAVLVAKQDIPKGTNIDSGMLETAIVPNQYIQPQAATSLDRVSGMIAIAPISTGEQITLSKLSHLPQQMGGGLAQLTPVGKRAVAISVDNLASLIGMIKPGDYVDVMAMVPVPVKTPEGGREDQVAVIPLFQNVLVLAVGQDVGVPKAPQQDSRYQPPQENRELSPFLTLALIPQEASLIAFVQEQGKIRLILRSPADTNIEVTQPAGWETLFQYLYPQQEAQGKPEPKREEPPPEEYVEIYRGLNKDKIILTK